MTTHTPAPWLRGGEVHLRDEITGPDESRLVCSVFVREFVNTNDERGAKTQPWPEGEANMALILAAPKLLAALINCVEHMEHSTPQGAAACAAARAAIVEASP